MFMYMNLKDEENQTCTISPAMLEPHKLLFFQTTAKETDVSTWSFNSVGLNHSANKLK